MNCAESGPWLPLTITLFLAHKTPGPLAFLIGSTFTSCFPSLEHSCSSYSVFYPTTSQGPHIHKEVVIVSFMVFLPLPFPPLAVQPESPDHLT